MKKVELLLPAGNKDTLRAAVNNGADAVYLGLNRFNARIKADNYYSFLQEKPSLPVDMRHIHSIYSNA